MFDKYVCLEQISSLHRNEILVTTMSVAAPGRVFSDGPLDFAMVESSMCRHPLLLSGPPWLNPSAVSLYSVAMAAL